MKQKKLLSGPTLIVIAAILWALDGIIRRSLFTLPPIIIVFYEHLIGMLILLPIVLPSLLTIKFAKKIFTLTGIIALLSGLLGTLWFTAALVKVNFISFSVVFLLQKLQPIFAISSANLLLKEKITRPYFAWAGLALFSAFFVTFPHGVINLATGSQTIIAALLAFGAAVAWGTSTTFSKMLLKEVGYLHATALRFLATTLFAFGAVLIMKQAPNLITPDSSQWLRFAFIAVSTGMVALLIYYKGLQTTQAKISTILELVFPLLAIVIDTLMYKTILEPIQYLAGAGLLYAIYRVGKLQKITT